MFICGLIWCGQRTNYLAGFVNRAAAIALPGEASSELGLAFTTLFVPGPRSWEIAKYWAFSHLPFREQRAEKFCSTPLNRRSAAHRRNTKTGTIGWRSRIRQDLSSDIQQRREIPNKHEVNIATCLHTANINRTISRVWPDSCTERPRLRCLA